MIYKPNPYNERMPDDIDIASTKTFFQNQPRYKGIHHTFCTY
jgi:hypothetical protein